MLVLSNLFVNTQKHKTPMVSSEADYEYPKKILRLEHCVKEELLSALVRKYRADHRSIFEQ